MVFSEKNDTTDGMSHTGKGQVSAARTNTTIMLYLAAHSSAKTKEESCKQKLLRMQTRKVG